MTSFSLFAGLQNLGFLSALFGSMSITLFFAQVQREPEGMRNALSSVLPVPYLLILKPHFWDVEDIGLNPLRLTHPDLPFSG